MHRELSAARDAVTSSFEALDDMKGVIKLTNMTLGKKQAASAMDGLASALSSFSVIDAVARTFSPMGLMTSALLLAFPLALLLDVPLALPLALALSLFSAALAFKAANTLALTSYTDGFAPLGSSTCSHCWFAQSVSAGVCKREELDSAN